MEEQKPEWAEIMKSSPFSGSHFTKEINNLVMEKAALRTKAKRISNLSIVLFSIMVIVILLVGIPSFSNRMPNDTTIAKPDAYTDKEWAVRHSYAENGGVLFTIFPEPSLEAGIRQGYVIHFTSPFTFFEDRTLTIRAVHKETGIQTILQHPTLITEPSPGYESLGRHTVFFELPLGGSWRHIIELDGVQYGDAVLTVNEPSWEVSPLFTSGIYQMRGKKLQIGFIDPGFIAGKNNKYMWHFWGPLEDIAGDFEVLAIKEGSNQVIPVYSADEIWTQTLNGADNSLPSSMSLPEPGRWRLMPYMNGKLIASIVVDVKEV